MMKDYINKYPGKTMEEIVELEKIALEQRMQSEKDEKIKEEAFWADILAQKYYKINFNGSSIMFVEIIKSNYGALESNSISTYIDSKQAYAKIENGRALNILWFRGQGPSTTEKITKEQYDEAVKMVGQVEQLLNTIRK